MSGLTRIMYIFAINCCNRPDCPSLMTTNDVLFIFIAMFRSVMVKTRKGLYEFVKYGGISERKKRNTPMIQIVIFYIEENIPIGSINTCNSRN